jgi:hypothetical protein
MQSTIYSCPILMDLELSWHIYEKYSNVIKIRPCEADWYHADRMADRYDKLTATLRNFAKRD